MRVTKLFVAGLLLGGVACSCAPPAPTTNTKANAVSANQSAHVSLSFYDANNKPAGTCAGVLVGPRAVLTAAHCATNKSYAVVTAPNAGGKKVRAHVARWFDWNDAATPKNSPKLHDIAIVDLDSSIRLKKYPIIADGPLRPGDKAYYVRRTPGATPKKVEFLAAPGIAKAGAVNGQPHSYRLDMNAGKLDQGGPVYHAKTGQIVGTVSGKGSKSKALYVAKTKALQKWLKQQLLELLKEAQKESSTSKPPASQPPSGSTSKPPASGSNKPPASSGSSAKPPSSGGGSMGKPTGSASKPSGNNGTTTDIDEETLIECEVGDDSCSDECLDGAGCWCEDDDCEDLDDDELDELEDEAFDDIDDEDWYDESDDLAANLDDGFDDGYYDGSDYGAGDGSDYGAGDSADYGDGDSADYGDGDSADYGDGDSADYGDGDSADYGDGDSADYGSDSADYGAGDSADYGAGDSADYGAGDDYSYDDGSDYA